MQTSAEGLVTFLPHSLPFLYQSPGGLTGTVVIQSSVPTAAAPVQLVQQQRCVFSIIVTRAACCDMHKTALCPAKPHSEPP